MATKKKALLLLLSALIAPGIVSIAFALERFPPLELSNLGLTAFIEETLKWGLSLTLFYLVPITTIPIAVATGFGLTELFAYTSGGAAIDVRWLALGLHILTGILLWSVIKKGKLWIGAVLVINTLIHWWWNLYVVLG